jgi:hypothetical protein
MHWLETSRHTLRVDRIVGRTADVEEEVEPAIKCYHTHVTNLHSHGTILVRKFFARFREPQRISMSLR